MLVGLAAGHGPERRGRGVPHHHLLVRARGRIWDVAVNLGVGTGASALRLLELRDLEQDPFATVLDLPPGWHRLAPDASSGALDVARHPGLADALTRPWPPARGGAVPNALRRNLGRTPRVLCFGEPYLRRAGLHNVHVNQGDAPGSRWAHENGPWQDGAILFAPAVDGEPLTALLLRFAGQELPPPSP